MTAPIRPTAARHTLPPSTRARADVLRQGLNLALALAQVAAPPLLFPDGFDPAGAGGGRAGAPGPTPLEPAGYAFVIWGAIFGGSLGYGVLQARPRAAASPLYRAVGWRTAAGFAASVAWLVAARVGPLWATVPLIVAMWGSLAGALVAARQAPPEPSAGRPALVRWLVRLPLALYAGWLSVAVFANAAEVLHAYGHAYGLAFPAASAGWGVASLACGGVLALTLLRRAGYPRAYAAAVAWALVGIAVANTTRGLSDVVAAVAVALAAVVLGVSVAGRRAPR